MPRLKDEIKMTKAFESPELEAFLALARTADLQGREIAAALKAVELSQAQYNVLRILRGAGEGGLPCGEIGARMVTFDPDVTRLLDKLERRGLVARSRESKDRRVVLVRITPAGLALAEDAALARELQQLHRKQFARLTRSQLSQLIALLEELRER